MDLREIFEGRATLDDLVVLNGLGYEFTIEDGKVTRIDYVR